MNVLLQSYISRLALTGLAFAETGVVNDVKDDENNNTVPTDFSLSQNYPNPFNPITMINYQLPVTSDVNLRIYNQLGQKVATLVKKRQGAGNYQVAWDSSRFSSGIYYYRIEAGEFQDVKKMILLR